MYTVAALPAARISHQRGAPHVPGIAHAAEFECRRRADSGRRSRIQYRCFIRNTHNATVIFWARVSVWLRAWNNRHRRHSVRRRKTHESVPNLISYLLRDARKHELVAMGWECIVGCLQEWLPEVNAWHSSLTFKLRVHRYFNSIIMDSRLPFYFEVLRNNYFEFFKGGRHWNVLYVYKLFKYISCCNLHQSGNDIIIILEETLNSINTKIFIFLNIFCKYLYLI